MRAAMGGLVRKNGEFSRIVEAADAAPEELLIDEINSGAYWFSTEYLIASLPLLQDKNAQGEYYLTDLGRAGPLPFWKSGTFRLP